MAEVEAAIQVEKSRVGIRAGRPEIMQTGGSRGGYTSEEKLSRPQRKEARDNTEWRKYRRLYK